MKKAALISLFFLLGIFITTSSAVEVTLFGPEDYEKSGCGPTVHTDTFTISDLSGQGQLVVTNHGDKWWQRMRFVKIWLNDELILRPRDFRGFPASLVADVNLQETNEIKVKLRGIQGKHLSIRVVKEVEAAAAVVCGPEGGSFSVEDPESPLSGTEINFPEGVLENNTIVTVSIAPESTKPPNPHLSVSEVIEITCSSNLNGYAFVTVPLKKSISETKNLYALNYDDQKEQWDLLSLFNINIPNNRVTFAVTHFSPNVVQESIPIDDYPVISNTFYRYNRDRFHPKVNNQDHGYCAGFAQYSSWYFLNHLNDKANDLFGLSCRWTEATSINVASDAHEFLDETGSQQRIIHLQHREKAKDKSLQPAVLTYLLNQLNGMRNESTGELVIPPEPTVILLGRKGLLLWDWHNVVVYEFNIISDNFIRFKCYDPNLEIPGYLDFEKNNNEWSFVPYSSDWKYLFPDTLYSIRIVKDEFQNILENENYVSDDWCEDENENGDGIYNDGDGSGIKGDNYCDGIGYNAYDTALCDDNCPNDPNADQKDSDGDGIGDACEISCNVTRWDVKYFYNISHISDFNIISASQMLIVRPSCDEINSSFVTDPNDISHELNCREVFDKYLFNNYDEILAGDYEFLINHQDGNPYTCDDTYHEGNLPIPELVNWSNGDVTNTVTPFIDWHDVPGAARYWVRFWNDTRTTIIYDSRDHIGYTTETDLTIPAGFLEPFTAYLLEIIAGDEEFEHGSILRIYLLTNPISSISLFHWNDDTYGIYPWFYGGPNVSAVTLTGPAGSGIINGLLYDDGQHIDDQPNDGSFSNYTFELPSRPNVGDVYIFDFVQNGNPDQVQSTITGIVDSFATLISPSGVIDPIGPTFNWTPPIDISNIDSQEVIIFQNGEDGAAGVPVPSDWIWSKRVDPNVSTIIFNDDGKAKEELITGTTYYWVVSTDDEFRNRAFTYQRGFTYGIGPQPQPGVYSEDFEDNNLDPEWWPLGTYEISGGILHMTEGDSDANKSSWIRLILPSVFINRFEADLKVSSSNDQIAGIVIQWREPTGQSWSGLQISLKFNSAIQVFQAGLGGLSPEGSTHIGLENFGPANFDEWYHLSITLHDDHVAFGINGEETNLFCGLYSNPISVIESDAYIHGHDAVVNPDYYVDNINVQTAQLPLPTAPTPTGLTADYEEENNYNWITWNTVPEAVSYNLYWGIESGVTQCSEFAGNTESTEFSHTGVAPGPTYFYKVTSVDADGNESELSEEDSAYVDSTDLFFFHQAIPTSEARDWESFTINEEIYLAVANAKNDSGNTQINSKIYKWNGISFEEIQAIATTFAMDWESFTINGETYLAVAYQRDNSYNYNLNSRIYKWNGISFEEFQAIATNGAMDWESFTIGADTYLAVANQYNGSTYNINSKIYHWNGASFVEIQAIPTNGAIDWKSFTINGETFLAVANYYSDSRIYQWNGASFVEIQAIATNGAFDWESFTINGQTYLAVANHDNATGSRIYQWNGASFDEIQIISTFDGSDWESFTINGETYLAVANGHDESGNRNIDSIIYKWNGSSFAEIQGIPTNGANDWESFTINGETFLVVANAYNGSSREIESKIYITTLSNLNAGLVAYWNFDEGSGTSVSDSVGTLDGYFVGDPEWAAGVNGSNALYFDAEPGERVHINVPDESALNELGKPSVSYTVSSWLKTTYSTQDTTTINIIGKSDGYGQHPLRLNVGFGSYAPNINGEGRFNINTDDNPGPDLALYTNKIVNDDKWHNLVAVRDLVVQKAYLYLDGIMVWEVDDIGNNVFNYDDVTIGNGGNNYAQWPFTGSIDEVRIYNRALSTAEIQALYNQGASQLPPSPSGLSASYDSVNDWNWITWNPVDGADSYNLYWGTEPNVTMGSEFAGNTANTEFSHTGVVPGWTYYYKVASVDADGNESALSNVASAYVPVQTLSPPTLLSATYNSTSDYNWITWSSVDGADAYRLYWGTDPGVTKGSEYAGQTSSTVFSHTGVVGGWTYYYRVCAVNTTTGAESELSNEMSVYVPVQIPSTPTSISATYQSANNWNYITWNAVDGATEYRVYWGTSPGVTKSSNMLTPTTTTDYGHSGVLSGYTYYYRVAAYNSAGESGLSAEVSAYVP